MAPYLTVEAAAVPISREAALSPGSFAASLRDACRDAAEDIAWDCYTRTALLADDGTPASAGLLTVMAEGGLVAAIGGTEATWLARLSLSLSLSLSCGGVATVATAAGHWDADDGTVRHWLGKLDTDCMVLTGKWAWGVCQGDIFGYPQF